MNSTQQLRKEIIRMERALEMSESRGEFDFELESRIQQAKAMLPENRTGELIER
ncbi:MAG TPA: hypothetical protein PK466_04805 [Thermotogota bacterium]|nr:hypothetical protein [Thermotogota bacterium]HPJ88194.1 hypothetical protein [Thermotogota bacterium]HPR95627.1 hypothetical protein [Thermotogota bacterium]